ncbi:MAG TPA: DNA repair protein RecN [Bacteroidales bacterium]|nr:DNA repair protein RecN [Bacteroidales bacterium]
MLQSIYIQNYALISELEIDFNKGLNIITGETGAGKSILLGALSLVLGQRADTSVLKDKSQKCFVEAKFQIKQYKIKDFFKQNDLDYEEITTIRREITDNGKSRAFINDTPVNLSILKDLSDKLIDIHSQHESLLLGDDHFQLSLVDSFANHHELLDKYLNKYEEYHVLTTEYKRLIQNADKAKADLDYFQFQFDQLEALKLVDGEQEELEEELVKLNHAEEIKLNLSNSYNLLSGEEVAILSNLKQAKNSIASISKYMKEGDELAQRLDSVYIELQDINNEIEQLNEKVEHDPSRIEFIRERLDNIYSLEQKHKVSTVKELIQIQEELQNKLDLINSYDFETEKIKKEIESLHKELSSLANQISANRKLIIPKIENKVVEILKQLGIPNANFKVEQILVDEFLTTGKEIIKFLFSANKNVALEELSKVASGGEISRLMLSIKSLIVETTTLPTIIFDEIDSGTSGEIADKMGSIIKHMSEKMQVINITHLPQIASKGDYHYLVYKKDNHETTNTYIKLLTKDERINEIAKMLSGEALTDAAIQNARVLLSK